MEAAGVPAARGSGFPFWDSFISWQSTPEDAILLYTGQFQEPGLPSRKIHAAYLSFICLITLPALSTAQTLAEPTGEAVPLFENYSTSSFPETSFPESPSVAHSPNQKGTPKAAES